MADVAASVAVTLVLDPSLDTQRVFKAKVVRADKDTDLAKRRRAAIPKP